MNRIDRRAFLKLAGAGSTMAAAGAVPLAAGLLDRQPEQLVLRAAARLPAPPLPALATKVLEGSVDLRTGTGLLTSRVARGHPEPAGSLPGSVRLIRVVGVDRQGPLLRLHGTVEAPSGLRTGEPQELEVLVDRRRGLVTLPFAGTSVDLTMT